MFVPSFTVVFGQKFNGGESEPDEMSSIYRSYQSGTCFGIQCRFLHVEPQHSQGEFFFFFVCSLFYVLHDRVRVLRRFRMISCTKTFSVQCLLLLRRTTGVVWCVSNVQQVCIPRGPWWICIRGKLSYWSIPTSRERDGSGNFVSKNFFRVLTSLNCDLVTSNILFDVRSVVYCTICPFLSQFIYSSSFGWTIFQIFNLISHYEENSSTKKKKKKEGDIPGWGKGAYLYF